VFNGDPRFLMAETYSMLHANKELMAEFDRAINKVSSPEEAVIVCYKYQRKVEADV